ncbi:MAG: SurA N-terminal domain-containing protein [Gammaproteobacteria bacterium]|nr:SurA N-terminal domain-containing protein [Gammaproteobacteria bacterium]
MLQALRERSKAWVARVIILLLIIPFALWGIQEYANPNAAVSVASVNGTGIDQREFQRAYEQERQRLRSLLGKAYDQQYADETQVKHAVVERMVEEVLIGQAATAAGLRISDAKLAEQLHAMPELLDNGIFSKGMYEQRLRAIGLTPAEFENRLRQALLSDQLNSGVTLSAVVAQRELERMVRLREQQREIGYMVLPLTQFVEEQDPGEAAISAYYLGHSEQFTVPEQVSIEYVDLAVTNLALNIMPTDSDLREFYDEHAANYAVQERRRVSQIVITPDQGDTVTIDAAKAKADSLVQRLRKGEAFAELAVEFSQDAASARQGGDLGFVARGVLPKTVEDALFALQPGAVSEPVQVAGGFHVLKLLEVQPASNKSFDAVRDQLVQDYRRGKAEQQYFEKLETLANLVFEHADTLAVAAQQLGLEIMTSALFPRSGGEGIASHPRVISAAFGDEVLARGFNSEPLEIADHHSVVLRIKERQPATVRSLAEARALIIERLREKTARERTEKAGMALQQRLAAGESPQVLAQEYKLEWFAPGQIRRDESKINAAVVQVAFQLPRPEQASKGVSVGGVALGSGDYAVVQLSSVRDGNMASLDAPTRMQLQRELQRTYAAVEYQGYLDGLKQAADIVIHPDKL